MLQRISRYTNLFTGGVAAMRQVDQKLIFIPVVFLLLRVWGTLQFIVSFSISIHHCYCVSHDAHIILSILAYLQVKSTLSILCRPHSVYCTVCYAGSVYYRACSVYYRACSVYYRPHSVYYGHVQYNSL